MAPTPKLNLETAIKLRNKGLTYAQIAEMHGLTVSGVQQIFSNHERVKPYISHKEAIPWSIAKEHRGKTAHTYLRRLSMLAQGQQLHKLPRRHEWMANQVINLGREILDKGLDYDYDPEAPPNEFSSVGGFFLTEPDPNNYRMRKLMARVTAAMTRKL